MTYPDIFKSRYPSLKGRNWICTIEPDDLKAFVEIGMKANDYGRRGGKARSANAKRDKKGRFCK